MPFAFAQTTKSYTQRPPEDIDENLGETIIVNVKSYEPTVLNTGLVEEADIPVFVYLEGSTIGSISMPDILTSDSLTTIKDGHFFIGVPPIKSVNIHEKTDSGFLRGGAVYKKPKYGYSLDNLGYVVLKLKRIPEEANVPDEIELDLTAEVEFDIDYGFGIGRQSMILSDERNENEWLKKADLSKNAFFSNNAYIRAYNIKERRADFDVYDSDRDKIETIQGLTQGEVSETVTIDDAPALWDQFRIRFDEVTDPSQKRVLVELSVNGGISETKYLVQGASLLPGSEWNVDRINRFIDPSTGEVVESLILKNTRGNEVSVSKNYSPAGKILFIVYSPKDEDKKQEVTIDVLTSNNEESLSTHNFLKHFSSETYKKTFAGKEFKFVWARGEEKKFKSARDENAKIIINKGDSVLDVISKFGLGVEVEEKENFVILKLFVKSGSYGVEDPCDSDNYEEMNSYDLSQLKKVTSKDQYNLYCTSVKHFRDLLSMYREKIYPEAGLSYEALANYMIAKAYSGISGLSQNGAGTDITDFVKSNAQKFALDHFNAAKKGGYDLSEDELTKLEEDVSSDAVYTEELLEDGSNIVRVKLLQTLTEGDVSVRPFALIEVAHSQLSEKFFVGDRLFKDVDDENMQWTIKDVKESSVIVEKPIYDEGKLTDKKETQTLNLDQIKYLDNIYVKLVETKLFKEVGITILPGADETRTSTSDFKIHIPVEKRPFDLTPEKIEKRIEKTEDQIEDLDKIIEGLGKLVESWRAVCLVTFAFLTIRNSFSAFGGGGVRAEARRRAMQDDGWKAFCEKHSGPLASGTPKYQSYDECMSKNSGLIDKFIDMNEKSIKGVDEKIKDFDSIEGIDVSDYKEVSEKFTVEGFTDYSLEDARKYMEAKNKLSICNSISTPYSELDPCKDAEDTVKTLGDKLVTRNERASYVIDALTEEKLMEFDKDEKAKYDSFSEFQVKQEQALLFYTVVSAIPHADTKPVKVENDFYATYNGAWVKLEKKGEDYYWPGETEIYLSEADASNSQKYIGGIGNEVKVLSIEGTSSKEGKAVAFLMDNKGNRIECEYEVDTTIKKGTTFRFKSFQIDNECKPFAGSLITPVNQFSTASEIRRTYADGAHFYCRDDNKPAAIPIGNGDYAEILDFYPSGEPKSMRIINVGSDGRYNPEGGDPYDPVCGDVNSLMTLSQCKQKLYAAQSAVKQGSRACIAGGTMSIGNKIFTKSINLISTKATKTVGHCQDVMDSGDCKLLFMVCDPVMCPPSRFNLAGHWPVENVVQTGLIGSIFLGLPNFPYEDPVPFCITGIHAGLQSIRSVLQSYVECLKSALIEGTSVGICDKIRSVFICELLWKEMIALFDLKGGILFWLTEKVYGPVESGGEYLSFKANLQHMGDSVSYFTQYYAQSAFAAYKGRSLDEVGTDICKAAIFSSAPGLGDFFDEIVKPESPPQFLATFSELTYSETQQKSEYSVFYHIYAGEDDDIDYSVYLKAPDGRVKYFTGGCNVQRATLGKGGFDSQNVDCVGPSGFTEVCVNIDGDEKCGFGKVTTEFGVNYINDWIVNDEANRNIDSAEDCVPDYPTTSPTLSSYVTAGKTTTVPLPGKLSLVNTGIVRVCAVANPGGSDASRWKIVGDCGEDEKGRDLGYCWIDTDSISLKDVVSRSDLDEELRKRGLIEKAAEEGRTIDSDSLLDEAESQDLLNQVRSSLNVKTPNNNAKINDDYIPFLTKLDEILDLSYDDDSVAEAMYLKARIFFLIAKNMPEVGEAKTEITKDAGTVGDKTSKAEVTPASSEAETPKETITEPEKKEVCDDNKDNDNDGLVDCKDPDCDSKNCGQTMDEYGETITKYCKLNEGKCCECSDSSLPCCDGCNFKSDTVVCAQDESEPYNIQTNNLIGSEFDNVRYICVDGYRLTFYNLRRYCSGFSASCNGDVKKGVNYMSYTCGYGCETGNPSCNPAI